MFKSILEGDLEGEGVLRGVLDVNSQITYTSGRDLLVGKGRIRGCFREDKGGLLESVNAYIRRHIRPAVLAEYNKKSREKGKNYL